MTVKSLVCVIILAAAGLLTGCQTVNDTGRYLESHNKWDVSGP